MVPIPPLGLELWSVSVHNRMMRRGRVTVVLAIWSMLAAVVVPVLTFSRGVHAGFWEPRALVVAVPARLLVVVVVTLVRPRV